MAPNLENEQEWRRYIVERLDCLFTKMVEMKTDIAALKVKAGIWGLLGGLLPAIGYLIYLCTKH